MKTAQPLESFNEFCATGMSAMKELNEANTHAWREFSEQQLTFIRLCTEMGNREWQLCMSGKDPLELMAAQTHLFSDFSTKCMECTREGTAKMSETLAEAMASFERFKPYWGWISMIPPYPFSPASREEAAPWTEPVPSTAKVKKPAASS